MVRTTKKKSKLPEASQKEETKDWDNVVFFFRPQQLMLEKGDAISKVGVSRKRGKFSDQTQSKL
jgi:hypothetical protein